MNEEMLVKLPVAERRGAWTTYGGDTWFSFLFAGGIDAVAAGFERSKQVGLVQRDVTRQALHGALPAPDGRWALLVELVGSDWVHFASPEMLSFFNRDFQWGSKLAEQTGLRVLTTGHEDCSGATLVEVQEGRRRLLRFESTGDDFGGKAVTPLSELEDMEDWDGEFATTFESQSHPPDWWRQFGRVSEAHQALLTELGAYVPYVQAVANNEGNVQIYACHEDAIEPANVRRMDLVVFGDPALARPNPANAALADAIENGDVEAARQAISAGASLQITKNSKLTPLAYAVSSLRVKEPLRLEIVRALVEAGADPNAGGGELEDPPLFGAVKKAGALPAIALEAAELLLDAGADVNARTTGLLSGNATALHFAISEASLAMIHLLVSRGADLKAQDVAGQTPLVKARVCREALESQLGDLASEQVGKLRKVIEYLEHVERGGDPGELADQIAADQAAADSARRRMRAKGARFEQTMKELGKLFDAERTETRRQIEDSLLAQPDQIALRRQEQLDWPDPIRIETDSEKLAAVGFTPAGDFTIDAMPHVLIRGFVHPEERLVAAIGQTTTGVTWWDVVRFHSDGSAITATSAPIVEGMHDFQSERFEKLHCAEEPLSFLLSELRAVPPPAEPVAVAADEFAERFETYYAEDIAAKKALCRRA